MSGRSLHLRDGKLITNRKTDRRQSRARPLPERLHDLNSRCRRRYPEVWVSDVRLGFLLPKELSAFVVSGRHGPGINIIRGFVQVTHGSAEECFMSAAMFFAGIARDRPAFTVLAVVSAGSAPHQPFYRNLSVVNGAMVVSSAKLDPRIYEVAA